jgi:hypothetical protein
MENYDEISTEVKVPSETAAAHPRSRAAGHPRRRRMKTEPGRAETNLS